MRTRAQSQREVAENLASFSARCCSRTEGESTSQAGRSDLHPTTFHTPSPCNQDDGPDPDPDYPDGDPDGRGSSDGDIPEDPAEPL
ncbi:hypothetical protein M404DRAFT_32314 [Pisolithus tinctorius Marx 270]|uniref:Uncharacterized protein n=1 Tax=Pisolithus tinctorius Marx 270 TaxID=870435 RepID=A0A0C3NQ86_PISTI|nr:hypothetical protein M404DRAFT_32314 [Pisolithus tinctorius Marx 270]